MNPNVALLEEYAHLKRVIKDATRQVEEIKKKVLEETKRIIAESDTPEERFVAKAGLGKFSIMRKVKGYEFSALVAAEEEALELHRQEEIARGANPIYGDEYVEFREEKI